MRNFNRERRFRGRDFTKSGYGDSKRFGRDSGRPERREFRKHDIEMHSATCGRCGARCEVPFKPSGSKPVYCSDCFMKGEKSESKSPVEYKKEFEIINEKLDRILEALGKD